MGVAALGEAAVAVAEVVEAETEDELEPVEPVELLGEKEGMLTPYCEQRD